MILIFFLHFKDDGCDLAIEMYDKAFMGKFPLEAL